MAVTEFGLLVVFVEGGKRVRETVAKDITEDVLFESLIDNVELPSRVDDDGVEVRLAHVSPELYVFPTETARSHAWSAIECGRGLIESDTSCMSVHLRALTGEELARYRTARQSHAPRQPS